MFNKLFGCVSQTLEISSTLDINAQVEGEKSKSLKNSLANLANGSYSNLTNRDDQQVSIVEKLANSTGCLNKLSSRQKEKKEKKLSQVSTTMTNTIGSKSNKKLVNDEIAQPQFSRKQNETYAK